MSTVFAQATIVTLFTLCKKKEKHKKRFSEMRKNNGRFSMSVGHGESKEGNPQLGYIKTDKFV